MKKSKLSLEELNALLGAVQVGKLKGGYRPGILYCVAPRTLSQMVAERWPDGAAAPDAENNTQEHSDCNEIPPASGHKQRGAEGQKSKSGATPLPEPSERLNRRLEGFVTPRRARAKTGHPKGGRPKKHADAAARVRAHRAKSKAKTAVSVE